MKNDKKKLPSAVIHSGQEKSSLTNDISTLNVGELIEEYAYAEAIVETVREPLVILNKNLRIKSANKSFFETFQINKKETYGKFIYDLNSGEWNIPKLKKLFEEILPQNTHFDNFEVSHDFGKIGHKTMLLNARRIILEENKTELILLAIEDVTQRKVLEQQKEEFINIASHELKTPITAIKALVQTLQKRSEYINEKENEIMQSLNKQTNKLSDMVNRLLIIGRIEEGKDTIIKKRTDLDALIRKVVKDIQLTTKKTIVINGESKTKIALDEASIDQLLTNLLTNAAKYSPNEEKIIITISKKENEVVVSVKDKGIGIAKEELPKIFDRYYRSSSSSSSKGFGLGLYISKEIVRQHNGRIWAESEKGKGSTFYFTLPIKK